MDSLGKTDVGLVTVGQHSCCSGGGVSFYYTILYYTILYYTILYSVVRLYGTMGSE